VQGHRISLQMLSHHFTSASMFSPAYLQQLLSHQIHRTRWPYIHNLTSWQQFNCCFEKSSDTVTQSPDKQRALEETKNYTTQSLASVAYLINTLANNVLQMLDIQASQLRRMESSINHISQPRPTLRGLSATSANPSTTACWTTWATESRCSFFLFKCLESNPLVSSLSLLMLAKMAVCCQPQWLQRFKGFLSLNDVKILRHSPFRTLEPVRPPVVPNDYVSSPTRNMAHPQQSPTRTASVNQRNRTYRYPLAPPPTSPHASVHLNFTQDPFFPATFFYPSSAPPPPNTAKSPPNTATTPGPPPAVLDGPQQVPNPTVEIPPVPPPPPQLPASMAPTSTGPASYGNPAQGAPQFYSMNRPAQQPQNPQVGGSLPFRRPSSVTGQPNTAHHNQSQLNGGPHFAQNQGDIERITPQLPLMGFVARVQETSNLGNNTGGCMYVFIATFLSVPSVVAIYDYSRDKEDELSFQEGSIIYVIKKNDDGWFEGVMNGTTGLFPGNYVESIMHYAD
ncbi:hypothetical protein GOODEAATRI_004271, partial [Goodea atripinnis]